MMGFQTGIQPFRPWEEYGQMETTEHGGVSLVCHGGGR